MPDKADMMLDALPTWNDLHLEEQLAYNKMEFKMVNEFEQLNKLYEAIEEQQKCLDEMLEKAYTDGIFSKAYGKDHIKVLVEKSSKVWEAYKPLLEEVNGDVIAPAVVNY